MTPVRACAALSMALAVGLPVVAARLAAAQMGDDRPLMCDGEPYTYAGGAAERVSYLAAINRATEPLSIVVRSMARARLRESTPIYERITLRCGGGVIDITVPQAPVFHSADNGVAVPWHAPDGGTRRLSQRLSGGRITQDVSNRDGVRHNEFVGTADGRVLTMSVRITSPLLPRNVFFSLSYRR